MKRFINDKVLKYLMKHIKSRQNKNTPNSGFNFNINNFYEDWDHDGVMNGLDCFPLDKKRQDGFTSFNSNSTSFFKPSGMITSGPMQNVSMAPTPKVNIIPQTPLSTAITASNNFASTANKWLTGSGTNFSTNSTAQNINTYNKLTSGTTPSSSGSTTHIIAIDTPKQTYIVPRPTGWPTGNSGSPPALNTGYKPESSRPFIPKEALRDENARAYVTKSTVVNPYYVQNKGDTNFQVLPRPVGWTTTNGPGPALNPGYKSNSIQPYISKEVLRDANTIAVTKSGQVINPYYVNQRHMKEISPRPPEIRQEIRSIIADRMLKPIELPKTPYYGTKEPVASGQALTFPNKYATPQTERREFGTNIAYTDNGRPFLRDVMRREGRYVSPRGKEYYVTPSGDSRPGALTINAFLTEKEMGSPPAGGIELIQAPKK
jgi:hypothetical protein